MDTSARTSGPPTSGDHARPGDGSTGSSTDGLRSVAQLNMLHSLAAKLNALGDVRGIGEAITAELRTIIDYHNCRVYLLQADGETLVPVSFRGELFSEYEHETFDALVTKVGEGITGHVAETGRSLLTPDASQVQFSVLIPGTDDVLESMLAVPMLIGEQAIGVISLSKLGYGQFDEEDRRLLEVLASHAAVAFENAKLLEAEREAAATSTELLRLSQALTQLHSTDEILAEAMATVPTLVGCSMLAAYIRNDETGGFRVSRLAQLAEPLARSIDEVDEVPAEVAAEFLESEVDPFVVPEEVGAQLPRELWLTEEPRGALIAPLRWAPDGFGALVLVGSAGQTFSDRDLRLARGIADLTSLALGTARRMTELERFHELVETLDAVFWEADARTSRMTFVAGRAERLLGEDAPSWPSQGRTWGEHVAPEDRAEAEAALRGAVGASEDRSLEYRIATPDGRALWVRDLVHIVRGGAGRPWRLRGLMVDVTERKRAEEALRLSERQYSEAFRREREASQRLRALDDMKNTFLEAVSHDLRTPLTSILGSALTLERTDLELPHEDALDLVHRIATNARKLERLLTDLLDLDRLQRGIVTPQRRPTDLATLVRRSVEQIEPPATARIEVDAEPVTISVDAAKVERILENLLNNAVRHAPSGTRIWVRVRGEDGGAVLTVEDDGPGVPAHLHREVFEPFRQAPGSSSVHSPGVGVGLSLVRRFAELHGGRAWLDDRAGGGASFKVYLPDGEGAGASGTEPAVGFEPTT